MGIAQFPEDDLLPISALQHLAFCERQWALIHLEGAWAENRLTAEGSVLHERVHEAQSESRGQVRIVRGLRLRSLRLGLTGIADVVEFRRCPAPPAQADETAAAPIVGGVRLPGAAGRWIPFPVEYKRGRPKLDPCDEVQLCAQALCLEEMLEVSIPEAALFYGQPMRRTRVPLTVSLRKRTESLAARLHELVRLRVTPPPVYEKKCQSCSLLPLCLPRRLTHRPSIEHYLASAIEETSK